MNRYDELASAGNASGLPKNRLFTGLTAFPCASFQLSISGFRSRGASTPSSTTAITSPWAAMRKDALDPEKQKKIDSAFSWPIEYWHVCRLSYTRTLRRPFSLTFAGVIDFRAAAKAVVKAGG